MTDRKLHSLAQAVELHYEELLRFVRRRTGSRILADDIVQDTWLRAKTSSALMPDNARAYVFRMASNLAVDHLKRESKRNTRETDEGFDQPIAANLPSPEAHVAGRQELDILAAAVRELPPRRRQIFILYRGQGLTMREIAERLDISEKTVQKHIAKAMVHCRNRLRSAGRDG